MRTEKVKGITNVYTFGKGLVSVGFVKNTITNIPSIIIGKLETNLDRSTDLMCSGIKETEKILISFDNLEGFLVFEKMVKKTKQQLKKNIK